jgi:hypothetical protein
MKKRDIDHVLRAAGRITGETQFVIVGSQALHGKYPDLPDAICVSAEVDLIARNLRSRTEWLNAIGADSPFHEEFGYYADPVDESIAIFQGLGEPAGEPAAGRHGRRAGTLPRAARSGDLEICRGAREGQGIHASVGDAETRRQGIVYVDFDDVSLLDLQSNSRPRGLPRRSSLALVTFNARMRSACVNFGSSSPAGSTTNFDPSSRISTFSPALTRICLAIAEGIRRARLLPHLRTC